MLELKINEEQKYRIKKKKVKYQIAAIVARLKRKRKRNRAKDGKGIRQQIRQEIAEPRAIK